MCTHNGASRIKTVLEHLARQAFQEPIPWEIVLVDNASTDGTAQVARTNWNSSVPLRIINEPTLGVSYARITGMNHCQYAYLGFIDDDNWVAPDWVERAYDAMDSKDDVAAIGSSSDAVFETPPPAWFHRFSKNYAVGDQYEYSGKIQKPEGLLWGAGLVIRKQAWEQLVENGFRPILRSRIGKGLLSGEESEVLLLFRLFGWNLYFDKNLKIQHYMPSHRLTWKYHLQLRRGLGATSLYLDLYRSLLPWMETGKLPDHIPWLKAILIDSGKLLQDPLAVLASPLARSEGNYRVALGQFHLGKLRERYRRGPELDRVYADLVQQVQSWPLTKGSD
ncbi:MAG: glycosyltransferase [Anaerolineaceae bacterium]